MLSECAGGCTGRLIVDIFDHTPCARMFEWHCRVLGYFAGLSSMLP